MEHKLTVSDLDQFIGTEHYYQHSIHPKICFSDGAMFVAENGGAFWLLDEIAITNMYVKKVARQEFQAWKLVVHTDRTAVLTCDDGNYNVIYSKPIPFTDFPLDTITLFFTGNVIFLPSEY